MTYTWNKSSEINRQVSHFNEQQKPFQDSNIASLQKINEKLMAYEELKTRRYNCVNTSEEAEMDLNKIHK